MDGATSLRDGLTREILDELRAIPTVDGHEHLPPESERVTKNLDFFSLFEHYCKGDLIATGATDEDMKFWCDREQPEHERWQTFKPFLSRIRTGSYARSALIVVRDLLELPDLNDDTFVQVGERLREGNTPGIYDRILRQRCNLLTSIQCVGLGRKDNWFRYLAPSIMMQDLGQKDVRKGLSEAIDREVACLDDVLEATDALLAEWAADPQIVGIKLGHAYWRTLEFKETERRDAKTALGRLLCGPDRADPGDARTVENFMAFELAARAGKAGLPLVIHTGLQAGNFHRMSDADPLLLHDIISASRQTRFDLFHGGMPWVREIATLAKYFPNVYLNMAWMHIISPQQSCSALDEWLDLVPNNKIFGFGGDMSIVEKVYGHLTIARQNIASVLAARIRRGDWTRAEASLVARRLMRDNAAEFYRIEF